MARTCDARLPVGRCGRPVIGRPLLLPLNDTTLMIELCKGCQETLMMAMLKGGRIGGGAKPLSRRVGTKEVKEYVADSGATFTAQEAREWLAARGLAPRRGRLGKDKIDIYRRHH